MAILIQERAGKLLDEGIFFEKQEIEKTDFEYLEFKANETKLISIKMIKIPPQTIIVSSMYGIHPIGHLSAIGSYNVPPGIIDKERIADFGMFYVAIAGKISKDEVVGATIMLPVREA